MHRILLSRSSLSFPLSRSVFSCIRSSSTPIPSVVPPFRSSSLIDRYYYPSSSSFSSSIRLFSTSPPSPSSASSSSSIPSPSSETKKNESTSNNTNNNNNTNNDQSNNNNNAKTTRGQDMHSASVATSSKSPITWRSVAVLVIVGTLAFSYYQYERERLHHERLASSSVTVGKPLIGGPFDLINDQQQSIKSSDFKGKYQLIYFGFTNCPEICPNELKKLDEALSLYNEALNAYQVTVCPIFISIDPKRDTPQRLSQYKQLYPINGMYWLTGSFQQIESIAKSFRVYFSAPDTAEGSDDDYLVDHSIFFYLMDRDGEFLEYFGKNLTSNEMAFKMAKIINGDNNNNTE